MTTIHVSPEFPLNRRMRKAVRRGKLRVVRVPGERLSLGGGYGQGDDFFRRADEAKVGALARFVANAIGDEMGGGSGGNGDIPFRVDRKTALELFEGDVRYWVPPYQRRYRWSKEQWGDFWGDIHGEEALYTGNVVLRDGHESGKLEIIDGQQRMTTIVLFAVAAIRVLWAGGNGVQPSESPIKEIANAFLAKGGLGDDIRHRIKITPNQSAPADFLANMMRMVGPNLPHPVGAGEVDQTQMRNAVEFFTEKLDADECDSSPEAIRSLVLEQAGENLIFSRVVVGSKIRPHPIFAALNTRGVQLKVHELIKNHCLSLCEEAKVDFPEREWERDIVRRIGIGGALVNGDREMPVFLRAVFVCEHGHVQEGRFFPVFVQKIQRASDALDFFREMRKHVPLYRGIVQPSQYEWPGECDKERVAMLSTFRAKRCRALILAARQRFSVSDFSETLRHCYAIFLRNRICGGPGGAANLPQLAFHNAAHRVHKGELSSPQDAAKHYLAPLYSRRDKFVSALTGYQLPDGGPGMVAPNAISGRFLAHFFGLLEKRLGNDEFDPGHIRHIPYPDVPDPQMHLGNWQVLEPDEIPEQSRYMTSKLTAGMGRDDRQKFLATLAAGSPDEWKVPDWRVDLLSDAEAERVRELLRTGVPDWRIDCLEGEQIGEGERG